MKITSHFYAGIAASALVLSGIAVVAPSSAQAQTAGGGNFSTIVIGGLVTLGAIGTLIAISGGDNDESPQSP